MRIAREQARELHLAAGHGDYEDCAAEQVEGGLEQQRDVEDACPVAAEVVCGDRFVPAYSHIGVYIRQTDRRRRRGGMEHTSPAAQEDALSH